MSVIVVSEQGARLSRKGGQIVLKKEGETVYVQPMVNLTNIIILGRIEISSSLISYAFNNGIEIAFVSMSGQYKGKMTPKVTANVFIRKLQYEKLNDPKMRLEFSRAVVEAKTSNYGRIVRKNARVAYEIFKNRLENMKSGLSVAKNLDEIRGLEGGFSTVYFKNLPAMVIEDFGFKKRIKHPPPDPMNILLSLSYTMLFNNVYAFVEASGLDPYCGFFHEMKYGHPALVSDLMEEFRAPVADALVIGLINRKQITDKHFSNRDGEVVFSKDGMAVFFEQYRKKINEKFMYKGLKLNFLQIIERQVWHFMRYLKGEDEHYEGYPHR